MANVQINEVQTNVEITESVGTLAPNEVKKLVALVIEHLKNQRDHEDQRRRDDTVTDHAYAAEGDE
jgi:hypothetical protein